MANILLKPWLNGLRDAGYHLEIACADTGYVEQLREDGFMVHVVSMSRSFNVFGHIRPFFQLRKLMQVRRYDGLNVHSPVASVLGRVAAWSVGLRPRVYFVHGFYFHDNLSSWTKWLLVSLEKAVGRVTDGFMFVSDEDHQTAKREGITRPSAKTLTIWNGIDLRRFSPSAVTQGETEMVRTSLGIPNGVPVVCLVGRLVREKGLREFIEMAVQVAQLYPDVRYLIVGSTLPSDRDQFADELHSLARDSGIRERIHFAGQVIDTAPYLRASSIFVLPSYREGFPRSIVEAMGCGLPTVTTNIRGCREAILDGVSGFVVPPRDSNRLAEQVKFLLGNPAVAVSLGNRARELAVALYDEEVVKARVIAFMDEIVESSRNASARIRDNEIEDGS